MSSDTTDLRRHLQAALDADALDEKNYHVRQALQHCDATTTAAAPADE